MANRVTEQGDSYIPPSGIIPNAAEMTERKRAEEERREKDRDELLLELQRKQTTAQTLQATSNVRIANLTRALIVVTLMVGFVSCLQFQAAKKSAEAATQAVKLAEDTREDNDIASGDTLIQMNSQSRAMQRSAKAMGDAAAAATAQVALMRQQIEMQGAVIDTISDVRVNWPEPSQETIPWPNAVNFLVINIGQTTAFKINLDISIELKDVLEPRRVERTLDHFAAIVPKLDPQGAPASGQSQVRAFPHDFPIDLSPGEIADFDDGKTEFHTAGTVVYKTALGDSLRDSVCIDYWENWSRGKDGHPHAIGRRSMDCVEFISMLPRIPEMIRKNKSQ